ncbi:MAG TPA: hypothetical protein VHG30_11310, partial [Microvirga sp.]|nr:hypothetical protein [Microvirga sp.]
FHKDFRHSSGLVYLGKIDLGKIDSGLAALSTPGSLKATIELIDERDKGTYVDHMASERAPQDCSGR